MTVGYLILAALHALLFYVFLQISRRIGKPLTTEQREARRYYAGLMIITGGWAVFSIAQIAEVNKWVELTLLGIILSGMVVSFQGLRSQITRARNPEA